MTRFSKPDWPPPEPGLGDYMSEVWRKNGKKRCSYCSKPIYYDHDSGYWLHAGGEEVDGFNGLYCSPEMWKDPKLRVLATPPSRFA